VWNAQTAPVLLFAPFGRNSAQNRTASASDGEKTVV
jgi:hypothetical protein